MHKRGVSRPMALQELEHGAKHGGEHGGGEHEGHSGGGHQQHGGQHGGHDRGAMLVQHHRQTLWIPWTLVLLGVWLMLSPFMLGYLNEDLWARPSGGRGAWFAQTETYDALRAQLMTWSDVLSGLLLVVLGWRSLTPDRAVSRWAACFVGIWLILAPVVLWAPTASGFVNDSLVGLLVIALTILIPGMPGMIKVMQMGPDQPPGWSYNPSSWPQRAVLIGLGFAGMMVSRYLAAYQLGYIDTVWDPFFGFGTGTQQVLDSDVSHAWPVSDAALGGAAYSFEFLMGWMGATARWRTMPWMVTMFGILVVPLGLSHIALIMSQGAVVHAWSTLALLAGVIMLPMVTLTVDEVVAMGQHVRQSSRRGDRGGSTWKVFWQGGSAEGCTPDERSPGIETLPEQPVRVTASSLWGASAPWPLVGVTVLGVWLMFAPSVFGVDIRTGAADVAHLGGAFVVVVAVVAMGEVVRAARALSLLGGLAIAGLVLLTDGPTAFVVAVVVTGLAVAALSVPRGRVTETYGTWDRLVR